MGYSCSGLPDPSLQCHRIHHQDCTIIGWCCVPAGDAGTCAFDAGTGDLIDDTSGKATGCGAQIKLPIGAGAGTAGYWTTNDDGTGSGSMVPAPLDGFDYMPVSATCSIPFSSAACMASVTPYTSPGAYGVMGFVFLTSNFPTSGTNPDGGTSLPTTYPPVSRYKGIRFWAMASDRGSQSLSIQFLDVANDMGAPGAACASNSPPLRCYNYFQNTKTVTSTWTEYEVDFDELTQRFTVDQGFYITDHFDLQAALGVQFVVGSDGAAPLTFDVCVADIYFVPK
jgi:hypothetical protein